MNILVVAAHADDEALGCGATIAKHVAQGDQVSLLIMADGVSSRSSNLDSKNLKERNNALANSCKSLGIHDYTLLSFPDNKLDTIPLLELTQAIEKVIEKYHPERIYTHFYGDLNIDHQLTCRAVITATRPQTNNPVKSILCFEVPSSSEWSFHHNNTFSPNYFINVTGFENKKSQALKCYQQEMRKQPHSRSINNVMNLLNLRGESIGCNAAEAFVVARIME